MTLEASNKAVILGVVTTPWWFEYLHQASNVAADVVPLLTVVLVIVHIALTVRKYRRAGKP
jgi:hypothetical protein